MALAGVKFDDGSGGFASNCFPVRSAFYRSNDDGGAWLVAHHAEQRQRFKAVLCSKHRTYSSIKQERKKAELQGSKLGDDIVNKDAEEKDETDDEGAILDGFFLMKHCSVDDPADLCYVNIASKDLTDVKEDDLMLFENVVYVNAGENLLPFEAFRRFSSLRELEIPLNGLRNIKISHTEFTNLQMLDLSYNNLSQDDLLTLGLLTCLKVLYLTGNNFQNLPPDLAMPYLSKEKLVRLQRYGQLEVLLLDDNKLMDTSVFAALAGLPKLQHLNLSKNEIFFVPQLKSVKGRVLTQDSKGRVPTQDSKAWKKFSGSKNGQKSSRQSHSCKATLMDLEAERIAGDESTIEKSKNGDENTPQENVLEMTGIHPLEEQSFHIMMAEEFSTGDLSARIKEFGVDPELTELSLQKENIGPQLPPFPELRYLNLADNKICQEDALLSIAAWPMLLELDIYNNPLTTQKSGDPPLLKRFLQERLGIQLNRVRPPETVRLQKNGAKMDVQPRQMKITDIVPKVPKLTVDEKIAQVLPPASVHKAIEPGFCPLLKGGIKGLDLNVKQRSVLPPIAPSLKDESTRAWTEEMKWEEIGKEQSEYRKDEKEEKKADIEDSRTFFMTQVRDVEAKQDTSKRRDISLVEAGQSEKSNHSEYEQAKGEKSVDERYKGYELLLDIGDLADEPELPPVKDVQGNIQALKHTLNHLLVYRDPAVELNKVKNVVPVYRRHPVLPAKSHLSYEGKVSDVLTKLKTRTVIREEELSNVLKDKTRFQKEFPSADKLLSQIQQSYNAVRAVSLKDAKRAQDITHQLLDMLPAPSVNTK